MNNHDKEPDLQAYAFAKEFYREIDMFNVGVTPPVNVHEAAAQLRAALNALPSAIEGCACGCKEFNEVKQ